MIKKNLTNNRGDKNVINGAKKTMKSCVKKHMNGKKLWQIVQQVLKQNSVKSKAQTITWMYIVVLQTIKQEEANHILKQYIFKMKRKYQNSICNENNEYKQKKKQREKKFVESAKILLLSSQKENIIKSVRSLFQYDKCSHKAIYKLQNYLQKYHQLYIKKQQNFSLSNTNSADAKNQENSCGSGQKSIQKSLKCNAKNNIKQVNETKQKQCILDQKSQYNSQQYFYELKHIQNQIDQYFYSEDYQV